VDAQHPIPTRHPIRPRSERSPDGHLLNDPELVQMRAESAARERELLPFSVTNNRRWKMYVLGATIFFPCATWFFTPAGFQSLWFQVLVSAAYGSFIAFVRPTGYLAVLATMAAGLSIQAFTGHGGVGFMLGMSMLIYGLIGCVVGLGEMNRLLDGR